MGKKLIVIIIVAAAAILGLGIWKISSALSKAGTVGDAAVEQFHSLYNAGKDDEIYLGTASRFRSATTREKFGELTALMREKLGAFKAASRTGIHLSNTNGDTTLNLSYRSEFEKGSVAEDFVFDYNGDKPFLAGYHFKAESANAAPEPAARKE